MKYVSLTRNEYILSNYKIVPLRKVDIQKIRIWRNTQLDVLRQNNLISEVGQINYYLHHIMEFYLLVQYAFYHLLVTAVLQSLL